MEPSEWNQRVQAAADRWIAEHNGCGLTYDEALAREQARIRTGAQWNGPAGVPSPRPLGSSSYRAPIQSSSGPPRTVPRRWYNHPPAVVLVALALVATIAAAMLIAATVAADLILHAAHIGR